jgi:FXSXX-COOH protein
VVDQTYDVDAGEASVASVIDVSALPLDAILHTDDTVLAHALKRLAAEVVNPGEVVAGWQSYAR